MLLLNPPSVRLGPHHFADVTHLAIDRAAERTLHEHGDRGPEPVFADVPARRVTVKIVRALGRDDLTTLRPGDRHELVFHTSPTTSDADLRRIAATAVVAAVSHQLTPKGATQTITLLALSPDGVADPITATPIPHSAD